MAAAQFAVFSFQVFQDSFTALPGKRPKPSTNVA